MQDDFCECPICKSYAIRIRRRFIDRIMGIFRPSYRYQCSNYACHWLGNIRHKRYRQKAVLVNRKRVM